MATMTKGRALGLSATATLPPEVSVRLLADVDGIARRMTRRIIADSNLGDPRFRSHRYLRTVTAACRDAVRTLIRLLADGRGLRAGDLERLGSMGAQQAELGVPLEVVFGAYRVAAKVVWQDLVGEPALLSELPAPTVVAITGGVLEYLDEISAAVGSAYLATRERLMRQRDRDRDRILQRVIAGDVSPDVRRLAAAVHLDLAPPYRVLACSVPSAAAERQLDALWRGAGALLSSDTPGTWIALVPPDRDIERLCDGVADASFGLGPTAVTLEEVAAAALQAQRALEVGNRLSPERRRHSDAEVGVFAALASDEPAMERFVERTLGRVLELRGNRRAELLATIAAVVSTSSLGDAAEALDVHRHTVVYRLGRLRELGVDLDQPTSRHELWLALRCLRLASTATR